MRGKQVPRRIERHKVQCCERRPLCLLLSGRFFHVALQRLRRLEGNGSNNCTGNYSIKRPIHSPPAFFLLCPFPPCSMQAAEGSGGSESSLGWVLHEPVVWLDTLPPPHFPNSRPDVLELTPELQEIIYSLTLGERCRRLGIIFLSAQQVQKNKQWRPDLKNHTITFIQDKLFLDANRKGERGDGDQLLPDFLKARFSSLTQYETFKTTSIVPLRRLRCSSHVQKRRFFQ